MTWTALAIAAVMSVEVNVVDLEGTDTAGTLQAISSEKVSLEVRGQTRDFPLPSLMALRPAQPNAAEATVPPVLVKLVDGSLIPANDFRVAGRTATVSALPGGPFEISTRSVAWVRFHPSSEQTDAQWREILARDLEGDTIVVRKPGEDGAINLDFLEGVFADVDEKIGFKFDGDLVPVPRKKVEGIIYYHPIGRELPDALAQVEAVSGAVYFVKSLDLAGDQLQLQTVAGGESTLPLTALATIDFSVGKVLPLTQVKPDSIEWTPFFDAGQTADLVGRLYRPRVGRGLDGKPLRLYVRPLPGDAPQVKPFSDGLAIHSRTELVYSLPEDKFSRFTAVAGISADMVDGGHVHLVVQADRKTLFEGPIRGVDEAGNPVEAVPLDLDVEGARRLKILVDFGENLDIKDHLNLCNPRLWK